MTPAWYYLATPHRSPHRCSTCPTLIDPNSGEDGDGRAWQTAEGDLLCVTCAEERGVQG